MTGISSMMCSFVIVVPTYKRTTLLRRLLENISLQTVQPQVMIIVDGDSASGEVLQMLASTVLPDAWRIVYVPSNHANLAYQRYLGWRVAKDAGCDVLLYFDDDLRLPQSDTIEKLVTPFAWDRPEIVGVTTTIVIGQNKRLANAQALLNRRNTLLTWVAMRLGTSRRIRPGGLSPVGHRKLPVQNGYEYVPVTWLRGGVMAYRMSTLDQACFSEDLFALTHVQCGLGEDTFLSRQVGTRGTLLMAFNTYVEHPSDDTPKAYPYRARRLAYAIAYSRRFLNDHYRSPQPPTFSDRLALLKNYVGVTAFAWLRALTSFKMYRFAYALGYTQGAIRSLFQKPTAKNLTPHIDWWADAEEALKHCQVLQIGHDNE